MQKAYAAIHETYWSNDDIHDLKTAAFQIAIKKIVRTLLEMGI